MKKLKKKIRSIHIAYMQSLQVRNITYVENRIEKCCAVHIVHHYIRWDDYIKMEYYIIHCLWRLKFVLLLLLNLLKSAIFSKELCLILKD